jgi:hypothetical protein
MAPLIVDDLGMVLLWGQEPLLWHVALLPSLNLHRRGHLYVAIPVGFLSPTREHYTFLSSRVVANYLQHRLPEQTALASLVDEQESPVAE